MNAFSIEKLRFEVNPDDFTIIVNNPRLKAEA